jgi:hypothetical protein
MAVYHAEIGFPVGLKLPSFPFGLWPTKHTRYAADSDRYGDMALPDAIDPRDKKRVKVVEVKTRDDGTPYEVLYRVRYSSNLDICLVVILDGFMVKTVWFNERCDAHRSLDRSRYDVPLVAY